jgi:hypothetical protein
MGLRCLFYRAWKVKEGAAAHCERETVAAIEVETMRACSYGWSEGATILGRSGRGEQDTAKED